ncbi:MAG TPA: PQQ-dependent sugar dehydrogenase [Actinokineospora sp.]|nr:PQQ-dependent sugar dehydrogenase [Actinokineospora sp.]
MSATKWMRRSAAILVPGLVFAGVTLATTAPSSAALPPDSAFQKVSLDTETSNPMALEIAPDKRVFYVDRLGDIKIIKPSGGTVTAATLSVFTQNEAGLLNLALDPSFATNKWIYIYYSPLNGGDIDRLSRFTVVGDTVDKTTEKVILDVPAQRAQCCHHGAGLVFDKKNGNLWLSTGDLTHPGASSGYTPIDEQTGRSAWDAQRTAANTNSLSGKVLRIHPEADGTYTIPAGNMFVDTDTKTRPEIYTMGMRNPFRMNIDSKTGYPVVGNYGPDAGAASSTRGPENTVEWDIISAPANLGWPYCIGNNAAYNDYNFATSTSGAKFNCAAPTNNSPNNTGLTTLPAAKPAKIWYHYASDPNNFPALSGGAPMAGPVYRYDANLVSDTKWPIDFDGRAIFGEWNNGNLFAFQLDAAGTGVTAIDRMLSTMSFKKPMDFDFGPDGALYVIEWGSGFGGNNTDSGIYRIDYVAGGRAPEAKVSADKTNGTAPLTVNFSSAGSTDPEGGALTYSWNFGDGTTSTAANPAHTFAAGNYNVVLTVKDPSGKTSTANTTITSGNRMPTVTIDSPPNGGLFTIGDRINVHVNVSDPEDGAIDCTKVTISSIFVHETHGHPMGAAQGCTAMFTTEVQDDHPADADLSYAFEATYTDKGGSNGAAAPLTGRSLVRLQTKHKQAEHFGATGRAANGQGTDTAGVRVEPGTDSQGGGSNLGYIQDGDWWTFDPIALDNITGVSVRASSALAGGRLELRWNAPDGPLVGTVPITSTGGWQTYQNFAATFTGPRTGSGTLYLVARNPVGTTGPNFLFNVNWVDFAGRGVTPKTISLKAKANSKFVTADNAGASALIANRAAVGPWERFDVFEMPGGVVGLRAHANWKLVTAESAGASPLIASRTELKSYERFNLIQNADGTVTIKALINGRYVSTPSGGSLPLIASATTIGDPEKFFQS